MGAALLRLCFYRKNTNSRSSGSSSIAFLVRSILDHRICFEMMNIRNGYCIVRCERYGELVIDRFRKLKPAEKDFIRRFNEHMELTPLMPFRLKLCTLKDGFSDKVIGEVFHAEIHRQG